MTDTPLAYCVKDAAVRIGIGTTKLYELIAEGNLKTVKLGRRTLVTEAALKDLLENGVPQFVPQLRKRIRAVSNG